MNWNQKSRNTSNERYDNSSYMSNCILNCLYCRLVIDSISPLEPERKCFRMVGGVLVERTIKEVLPALETNFNGVSIWSRILLNGSLMGFFVRLNKSLSPCYNPTSVKKMSLSSSKRNSIFKLCPSSSNKITNKKLYRE